MQAKEPTLTIELKHNGERLTLRRVRTVTGVEELHLFGTLPPQRQGPPLHIHFAEDEHGEVVSGVLSASLDGKTFQVETGGHARFPIGSKHRWWNDGDKELVLQSVNALTKPANAIFKGVIRDVGSYLKSRDGAGTTRAVSFAARLITISALL